MIRVSFSTRHDFHKRFIVWADMWDYIRNVARYNHVSTDSKDGYQIYNITFNNIEDEIIFRLKYNELILHEDNQT